MHFLLHQLLLQLSVCLPLLTLTMSGMTEFEPKQHTSYGENTDSSTQRAVSSSTSLLQYTSLQYSNHLGNTSTSPVGESSHRSVNTTTLPAASSILTMLSVSTTSGQSQSFTTTGSTESVESTPATTFSLAVSTNSATVNSSANSIASSTTQMSLSTLTQPVVRIEKKTTNKPSTILTTSSGNEFTSVTVSSSNAFSASTPTLFTQSSRSRIGTSTSRSTSKASTMGVSRHTGHTGENRTDVSGGLATVVTETGRNCLPTIGLTVGICAGVLMLLSMVFFIIYIRSRNRWRDKMKAEQHKTDLWSTATYNNTIVNANFMDYQLASPDPVSRQQHRETSSVFDNSSLAFYYEQPFAREHFADFTDSGTLRRNTYSAPASADHMIHRLISNTSGDADVAEHDLWPNKSAQDPYTQSSYQMSVAPNQRDRASTFSSGKNVDRHVLLKHEERLDNKTLEEFRELPDRRDMFCITEL